VVGFKKVPAYSYDNDPNVLLTRGLSQSASMSNDLLAMSQNAQHRVDTMTNKADAGAAIFAGADDQFSDAALMATAQHAFSNLNTRGIAAGRGLPLASGSVGGGGDSLGLGSASVDPTVRTAEAAAIGAIHQAENDGEPNGRIATRGFDAMDVEFDIRSAKPLHNPYVVTMTKFRTGGGKPGMVQNLVYAEALHPIDEHLSHVHFTESGFPFNYELVDFQLHIYNQGEEVATNIAANRVELTRDEAFEYIKSEYIGAHTKDTLPAVPAMGKLPSDLPALLAHGKYADAFYVRVNKEGLAYEAYSDAACTKRIDDDYLDSVVKKVRFKPALNNGKPVDGVASLKLGQLAESSLRPQFGLPGFAPENSIRSRLRTPWRSWLSMVDSLAGRRLDAGAPAGADTGASVASTILGSKTSFPKNGAPLSIRAGITWSMSPLVSCALSLTLQRGVASWFCASPW
jgi:hypothetical protein